MIWCISNASCWVCSVSMRKSRCTDKFANALAFGRSMRVILCLFLVMIGTLNLGHYSHTYAYEVSTQMAGTDDGADSCAHDVGRRCHLTSACPYCAPIVAYEGITKSGPVFSPAIADALVSGHFIAPHLRPPSFLLQI